ncbi:MAG TPA: MBL fold metallo-hydrolase [Candidatus Nitrosotenuis sp.]|nr:MBL fold metallo-hydrolase [Candidatus Nitrosotenuis sp.]
MSDRVTKLQFWGVRGSTPTVDRATARYGGNTACLELLVSDGTHIILDCGTGIRALGNRWLASAEGKPLEAHVLLTHYHWDHIQGLPFCAPLYSQKNYFHFYSFRSEHLGRGSLQRVLEAQMAYPYFPVDVSVMSARREFSEIAGGDTFQINETRVTARWLNHPQGCLGFRLETPDGIIAYTTDNEPGVHALEKNLKQLAAGADIFINDAQYSPEQLAGPRKGWGHSSWQEGVKIAEEVGAKNLVLFHHDPDSSDRDVDMLLREARRMGGSVWSAAEGMVLSLSKGAGLNVALPTARGGARRRTHFNALVNGFGEDGSPFQEKTFIDDLSLQGAFLYLNSVPRLQSEVTVEMEASLGEGRGRGVVHLRGFVVRREAASSDGRTGVGLVFTEDIDLGTPEQE